MPAPDLANLIDQYHRALDEFFRGDPGPAKRLYSHREDVSLANPFGRIVVGWQHVEETMERPASNYRDGGASGFDTLATYATAELAYLVELERFEARVGGEPQLASGALRVTTILRPEDGVWKIVHRHADPITAPRAADSVLQR